MKKTTEESKKKEGAGEENPIDELLMKPFSLGWTREVVRRTITKNGIPNCDIYYFNPSGKRIRSRIELQSKLTDGLSPECFSFKKVLIGVGGTYETVRNARCRKKGVDVKKQPSSDGDKPETPEKPNERKPEKKEDENKADEKEEENEDGKQEEKSSTREKNLEEEKDNTRPKRIKLKETDLNSKNDFSVGSKKNTTEEEKGNTRPQPGRRRTEVLKKMREATQMGQSKVISSVLSSINSKKGSSKRKLPSPAKSKRETGSQVKKSVTKKSPVSDSSQEKAESEEVSAESGDQGKKSPTSDLKSIVKKNIGKYRELREKQKLGVMKAPTRKIVKKSGKFWSEPISKNRLFYLKPLEKGWRRELVFRSISARNGQQADVYYFHPSGKKLRSCREIAENLTHGLSIECFTFRKEPLGCGEPSEIVRNARTNNKH